MPYYPHRKELQGPRVSHIEICWTEVIDCQERRASGPPHNVRVSRQLTGLHHGWCSQNSPSDGQSNHVDCNIAFFFSPAWPPFSPPPFPSSGMLA